LKNTTGGLHSRSIYIIGILFFVFGFITWLNAVLIPYLQIICELSLWESYLVTFSFFISYMLASLPAAWLLKKTGFRKGMAIGLLLAASGALLFIPAGTTRLFGLFLAGLFIQGAGIALLQTASNPYVTLLGPPESAAKRISIMGVCNVIAGMLAPWMLGSVTLNDVDAIASGLDKLSAAARSAVLDGLAERIILPYMGIVIGLGLLALMIFKSNLPEAKEADEASDEATVPERASILHYPHLLLGVVSLFLYVGVEVIGGNTVIGYAEYAGYRLETAKYFASFNLLAMLIGYLVGIVAVPRYVSQAGILKLSALSGLAFVSAAMALHGPASVVCITLLGFSNAMIWPSIWPLAISHLGKHTKIGSALLVMGITGGAVMPLLYASAADACNHKAAYWIAFPCYLFIVYYAIRGHRSGLVHSTFVS
jgi:FHS family L-fucose permease-like MFS transporter